MTVIAANRRSMAGDSRVTIGSVCYRTDKIFHIGDSFVGVCGDANLTTKFLAWFRKECPSDEIGMTLDDDHQFNALVLNARGLFLYCDCTEPDAIKDKAFAIGAGCDIAIAGMAMGLTPAAAVKLTCKLAPNTCGLPVKVLTLGPVRGKKKKAKTAMPTAGAQTDARQHHPKEQPHGNPATEQS